MRIAVTAEGGTLESSLDPRFGRCPYVLFVETDDLSFDAVENANMSRDSGAGIQTAELIAKRGARCVLTGHCGPKAQQVLAAAGVVVIGGCSGTAGDAIDRFKAGGYSTAEQVGVEGQFRAGSLRDGADHSGRSQPMEMTNPTRSRLT